MPRSKNGKNGLSKYLSWLLRHGATQDQIEMSDAGYVLIESILKQPQNAKVTLDDIRRVVDNCPKNRFQMEQKRNKWYIRATQGHSGAIATSIDTEKLLTRITEPLPLVVHGTTKKAYAQILESGGLKPMGRSFVHFAISDSFIDGNIEQSGIRSNSTVLIYLDMPQTMNDGIEFYMSANKVVLSSGIDGLVETRYFERVLEKKITDLLPE